jgi:uncharacterized membrane protein
MTIQSDRWIREQSQRNVCGGIFGLPYVFAVLLSPACTPVPPVGGQSAPSVYSAVGKNSAWELAISADHISLSEPHSGDRLLTTIYPAAPAVLGDGRRVWESNDGSATIRVEAQPAACTDHHGRLLEDRVTVSVDGVDRIGCGGRRLGSESK